MALKTPFKHLPAQLSSLDVMQDASVIPVIVLNDIAHAVPMARALVAGGIRMLEVTLRTSVALQCIERIAQEVPEAVVGAGTVRTPAEAQAAARAGARFAVSPGFTHAVGQACRDNSLPLLPGVATGSEIMLASEAGFKELKFFPAMQAGGPAMLKAWSGPFFDVKFCPTGGVSLANAKEFLSLPNVVCVGGSWLVPNDALASGDWARITLLASEAARIS
jgi:2-dehydro-3-deoxyphosphogluconate aldolase / (4S)-4-hydroxy-2-oxoglutarate aldolase